MANFPTIGLGQAGQNAFNNKWAGYTPPVAPAPTPTAPTQQSTAPKPSTLPTQPAQQGATVIPVTTMGSQQQINIPTQQQPMTAPVTMNYADQLMQQANADSQNTQVQDYQNTSIMQMLDAYNNLAGESAYRTQAIQDSNINGLKQNLQNINNQILTKQAEIQQDDVRLAAGLNNIEKKAIPMEFITGQQQSVQRDAQIARALKMSEIGVLNAQVLAGQGNIELAQKTVDEAVAAKFAPYKEFIDIRQKQLEAIAPLLSKAEAKQAAAQQVKVSLAMKEIDKVSDFQKQVLNNAISRNAPQSVLNAINKGQSIEEITKAGAGYLKSQADILDEQLKRMQISKIGSDIAKDNAVKAVNAQGLRQLDDTEYSKFTANPNYKSVSDGVKYQRALADFKKAVEKYGTGEIFSAKGKGELGSAYSTLVATTKDYYTLGTLDAGVQKLVSLGVPEPTKLRIRDKRVLSAVDELSSQAKKTIDSAKNQLGKSVYGDTVEYQSLLEESGLNNQDITEEDYTDQILNSSASSPFNVFGQ